MTGEWTLPDTGGAQTWTTATRNVFLTPGQQILRINVLAGGFNLNWMELSPVSSGPIVNGNYKIVNAASGVALDLDSNNVVITNVYSGLSSQQWNFQHIGGGQYHVSSVAKGNSWYDWSGPLRLLPWGWGAGGDTCYIFLPTGGGYYRFLSAGGGTCFSPSSDNPPQLDDATYTGATNQQWAISPPSAPPFPAGLSATAISTTEIHLAWNTVPGATSYTVKRSIISGGPYTTVATGVTATEYTDIAPVGVQYYYVVSAIVGGVESINSLEAMMSFPKLTGTIIGTAGSWNNSGNTIAKVFDNNLSTFFDGPTGNGCWVGLDFGAGVSNVITQINYCPRSGYESRMVGGIFQGANQASFSDAVTLGTVGTQPPSGGFTSMTVTDATAFRYVRYLSPDGGYGNVAELEFYGHPFSISAQSPSGLVATAASTSQISLVWNTFSNAVSYNVKRSITNGGPYAVIATGVSVTNYLDSGLAGGTRYYYVVSAMVSTNETPDSVQTSAATLSPAWGDLVHRYNFGESSGSTVADSVGGPVWTGTLPGGGTLSGGQLTLASASQQYVSLPAGVVGPLSNITVMAWVKLNSLSTWSRIFDFGNNTTTYMFLTPQCGGSGTLRFAITTNSAGGEQQINCSSTLSTGAWHQAVVTLSSGSGVLYLDGVAVGTNNSMTLNPASLGTTVNNYIGKSQWADPYMDGQIDEFRIYDVGLSSEEIAATAVLGANQQLSTNDPPMSAAITESNLNLTWPLANAGFTLQSCTNLALGNWMNVNTPMPQIVGDQWQVTIPASSTNSPIFYRLLK